MTTLRLIFGDQLNTQISSLKDCQKSTDLIFMAEVWNEATYVKHHIKKIAYIFSAMRHFAEELKSNGYKVQYIKLDNKSKQSSFTSEIKKVVKQKKINHIIATEPSEYRVLKEIRQLKKLLSIDLTILDDDRFLCSHDDFQNWLDSQKQPRMEFFYREMRKQYNILMHNDKPVGGKWNYDKDNRKPASNNIKTHKKLSIKPDKITNEVLLLVKKKFNDHFGELLPFEFATTRKNAVRSLKHFIKYNLPQFGDYQDVMLEGEPNMFHSLISQYINSGLLLPIECIDATIHAYVEKQAPLNAVEGFIRQILGWREFVRGIYWTFMPSYQKQNFLKAKKKLPDFFWTGNTDMNCLKQCISETKHNAYAHHIQRLMVLGNFCLLTGIHPKHVNEWYLIVYADAYEWVELPNVTGMILFADGGVVASKPYAAGGAYINKMSNYCKSCRYNIKEKTGEAACPFNYLYWDFLIKNKATFKNNHRLKMIYSTLNKMSKDKVADIKESSQRFLKSL